MANICPTVRKEKLMLCTDGSRFSEGAVREAIKLAKNCSSGLSVMSVIETNPEFETIAPQVVEKAEKSAREQLDSVRSQAKREGVDCDIIIRQGEDSYEYIIDEAAKRKITMIIMGRRGRTGLKRLMMGSVTARVIGHAKCNVLVVPSAAQVNFKTILLATDGSRYSEAAASEAIGIARRNGSTLIVLSVVPSESMSPMDIVHSQMHRELIQEAELREAEKNVAAVLEAARKESVSVSGLVLGGKPAETIVQTVAKNNADIIVLGSHGATGIERFLMGSVTERVIVLSSCAVLVVKAA
jgi:nucleotide-binding universal stress UspA family protein